MTIYRRSSLLLAGVAVVGLAFCSGASARNGLFGRSQCQTHVNYHRCCHQTGWHDHYAATPAYSHSYGIPTSYTANSDCGCSGATGVVTTGTVFNSSDNMAANSQSTREEYQVQRPQLDDSASTYSDAPPEPPQQPNSRDGNSVNSNRPNQQLPPPPSNDTTNSSLNSSGRSEDSSSANATNSNQNSASNSSDRRSNNQDAENAQNNADSANDDSNQL